ICADIRLAANADIEEVHARILYDVQRFLTPPVHRYSLLELLDRGKTTDEIFDGQVPRFGFFDEDELDKSTLPDAERILRSSDLIGILMQVPGVVAIPKFHLKLTDDDSEIGALWSLPIEKGRFPLLSPKSPMRFYKDIFRYNSHADEVAERLRALENEDLQRRRNLEGAAHDLPIPLGVWRDLGPFRTVQHDLPPLYGVGPMGVSAAGSEAEVIARRAKAKQLQAYLLFFDQILSNHAALLEALPGLLSPSPAGVSEERVRRTYFARLAEGVNEVKSLFKLLSDAADETELQEKMALLGERLNGLVFSKTLTNEVLDQRRRNRQLDHLLARYAENFDDYVLMMHQVFGGRRQEWEIIDDKDDFLNEHPLLSRHRARAFTGTATGIDAGGNELPLKLWYDASDAGLPNESVNVAGVVRRVARLTGIDNYRTRNLAKIEYEVYQEKDEDGVSEFRFRVVDVGGKKILLSGSTKYATEEAAILEMRNGVNRALFPDGYERKTTVNGKFYFNLVDAGGEVLARRIEYFETEEQREDAIQYLIDFLTERYSPEGLFLVEHLLLRPLTKQDDFLPVCTSEGCQTCESPDPYSFRVSVVLPGYAPRFSNMVFRTYFERTLRAELPAHILAKICWIGEGQMAEFEVRYRAWLEYRQSVLATGKPENGNQTLNDLLEILQNLHTIYPPGTLHDCEEDREDRPIVLGRSQLGTHREEDLNPDD
ncbi:MAG: YegP family protein, partial [Bacteroidetes bacterium]|nr:YegP family protein [Bacteroidota bacterium]